MFCLESRGDSRQHRSCPDRNVFNTMKYSSNTGRISGCELNTYMHACIHAYIYIQAYMHACGHMGIQAGMHTPARTHTRTHKHKHHIYTFVCTYVYIYICVCVSVCITRIYIHTHLCGCVYMHIEHVPALGFARLLSKFCEVPETSK